MRFLHHELEIPAPKIAAYFGVHRSCPPTALTNAERAQMSQWRKALYLTLQDGRLLYPTSDVKSREPAPRRVPG
jgi:hypothetical protein